MKTIAAVLYELNQPLKIELIEMPILKSGQVLVKVEYSGVCHSQLMEARGGRGPDNFLPHLLGHEGSGVVIDIGEDVRKVKNGDKVVLTWIKGEGADCGGSQYRKEGQIINAGAITTFNEYAVISENRCVRIPDDISLDIAALFGCAVLTGAGIVMNTIRPEKSNSILVWGVGGIGLCAVLAAKLCNCKVIIAIDVQDSKLDLAREFGATNVINALSDNAMDRVREIVREDGVDYAVEAAGLAITIEQAFQAVRKKGGLCVFASHPSNGQKICIEPHDLISGKRIQGSWGGESLPDRDIPRYVDFYRQGKLPIEKLITHRYKLNRINDALKDLEMGWVGRPLIETGNPLE